MGQAFSAKLQLALKVLSLSRGGLAADLGVDKSVVSRWVTGAVQPSAQNLALLTTRIARAAPGFTVLDWDRDLESLAGRLGADPALVAPRTATIGLPQDIMDLVQATTERRAAAYEGFFRSTRLLASDPQWFIHDEGMIRRDAGGLLRLNFVTGGVHVDAWILPIQSQLYIIGAERTNGSPVFGIFNGTGAVRVDVLDGLTLTSVLDAGRTPTAAPILIERVGDLTGDVEADDATFAAMGRTDPREPVGSVPESVRKHLLRDIGPEAAALGGDWVMRTPLGRSLSR